nr:hypothetical protein [Tanacetum cinerariifolium]
MSSDSHATITYTSMSSYEVIVNRYFGMPMDPLDPYAQLIIEVPPSPDYIPGPEALPSPDCIPGPEYPEYLPPADDVLPAEEQPLPTDVSPTSESPGYITDLEPEMEPEEEDGDDEKSIGNSIDYPTSKGDDDANDDGDDLSEDDADDENEEESLDSEEEEKEHLALIVPAPALNSSISDSEDFDKTEPFEEEVERLLSIPTPSLSPVSSTSYQLPPFLMPLPIFTPLPPPPPIILPRTRASMVLMRSAAPSTFILASRLRTPPIGTPLLLPIPLPTTSFPLPLLLPSTSGSESIPDANMPLRKRTHFITPTGGYEVGESSVAAAARQINPTLTVDVSRRAEDILIGRLMRERRYFFTLSTTYAQEFAHSCDYCTHIIDYCQSREIHTSTLVTHIEALQRDVNKVRVMSSDSNATITYTSMSSYEVIVNRYFGMPMDPLDPYAQLIIEVPPSPDYIPGPEALPSPDCIPGPEYPEYLLPADDVLPAEEQPLPADVLPTFESPGYITDLEPEMEPEEEDGDDEKSNGNSIDYPTSKGDDDANDDGDDLSEDDADDENEEESLDSEEEEKEHLALIVPAQALNSSISDSEDFDKTEPFEEESEVERLLSIPTPSLSPVSSTSYPLPPFLMPLPIFTPLPPPPPIILPRTRASMVLMRSAAPSTFILASQLRTPPIGTPPIVCSLL